MNADFEQKAEEKRKERLVKDIKEDYLRRRDERRSVERGWELNMNFLAGNQYCDVAGNGEIEEELPLYGWQGRRVYNYIAPTVETRCAKLRRMRPKLAVRAFSDEDADLKTAKLCSDILANVSERIGLDAIVSKATVWSETCGTAFYCVSWENGGGNLIGYAGDRALYEGEVSVSVLPPFEIYPDSLAIETVEGQPSIIRARAVAVEKIEELYGVKVPGREISEFGTLPYSAASHEKATPGGNATKKRDAELLIERYTAPCSAWPQGRVEVVAGEALLYEGELPFVNGDHGRREYPFVKQTCGDLAGAFFGICIVDRLIPLQRSYNAVRNRKQEFLNRLSLGVLAVEDGSVDAEEIAQEGLYPGKVLVYRQGSEPPKMLDCGTVPEEFAKEEERLAEEFVVIGGSSEVSQTSSYRSGVTSATGLQLLIDQDDARLAVTAGNIARSMQIVGRQILRLYKQFAGSRRIVRMTGEGKKVKLYYFDASDISADDILFEEGEEINPATRKNLIFDLLAKGLLADEEGKVSLSVKNQILEAIGCGTFENVSDITVLHRRRAQEENLALKTEDVAINDYDDHAVHVLEHTRFLLSEEGKQLGKDRERAVAKHLEAHRLMIGG